MKLSDLEIEGFGVWQGLRLAPLEPGLNVFYGPNEAGKTTLLEFVRALLYGFTAARRARYLPPVAGGPGGGSATLETPRGALRLTRTDDPGGDPLGELAWERLTADHQVEHSGQGAPSELAGLLRDIDETVFDHVFALGIGELHELGALDDSAAARHLYRLSAGLDRVSLLEVATALRSARDRLWRAGDEEAGSIIAQLLTRRDELHAELAAGDELLREYLAAQAELDQVQAEASASEQASAAQATEMRVLDMAAALRDPWEERELLSGELAALGPLPALPEGATERLEALNAKLHDRREAARKQRRRMRKAKRAFKQIEVNSAAIKQGPRIAVLCEQEPWIAAVTERIEKLTEETLELERQLTAERQRLGVPGVSNAALLPELTTKTIAPLWNIVRAARRARERFNKAKAEVAAARNSSQKLVAELNQGLSERGESDVLTAAQEAGRLVSQLRRRQQLEQRIAQLNTQQDEAEGRCRKLLDDQMLPAKTLAVLGATFSIGAVLVLAGFLLPLVMGGKIGWFWALLGVGGMAAAGGSKVQLERRRALDLEDAEEQAERVRVQSLQAREELRQLDAQLGQSPLPYEERLNAAVADLARLEQLLPLGARRKAAQDDAQAALARKKSALREYRAARGRWSAALTALGVPGELTPVQVKRLATSQRHLQVLDRQYAARREDLAHQEKALGWLETQVDQLLGDVQAGATSIALGDDGPETPITLHDKLRILQDELRLHTESDTRRQELERMASRAGRRFRRAAESVRRLRRRRQELLREAGVVDEAELAALTERLNQAAEWTASCEALSQKITDTLAGHVTEEALRQAWEKHSPAELTARRAQLVKEQEGAWKGLAALGEERGRLTARLEQLAADRTRGDLHLELAEIDARLAEASRRWQTLAAASRLLDALRKEYEEHRQPETLAEASRHFARLTRGRYCRVWTRLDSETLLVDDSSGRSLSVEVLSRGAREQLLLSIRLALAAWFSRQGTQLPLVLDDLLVNFDAERSRAAAELLRDFAADGCQILLFTCHEHVARMFAELDVDVRTLPAWDDAASGPQPLVHSTTRELEYVAAAARPEITPVAVAPVIAAESPSEETLRDEDLGDEESSDLEQFIDLLGAQPQPAAGGPEIDEDEDSVLHFEAATRRVDPPQAMGSPHQPGPESTADEVPVFALAAEQQAPPPAATNAAAKPKARKKRRKERAEAAEQAEESASIPLVRPAPQATVLPLHAPRFLSAPDLIVETEDDEVDIESPSRPAALPLVDALARLADDDDGPLAEGSKIEVDPDPALEVVEDEGSFMYESPAKSEAPAQSAAARSLPDTVDEDDDEVTEWVTEYPHDEDSSLSFEWYEKLGDDVESSDAA